MSKKAVCKFRCDSVTNFQAGQKQIKLSANYDPALAEDQRFSTATPSGHLEAMVNNPSLDGFFEPGKAYYIEIVPVEE